MSKEEQLQTGTETRARELFDASVEQLDAQTRARLRRARQEAVVAAERPRLSPWRTWIAAAALASTVLVAVLIWRAPEQASSPAVVADSAGPASGAVELLADGEDLDLVENDLEFYEWLDATGLDAAESAG